MINREITYKRDMSTSYMIIPAMSEESFDENVLLKSSIEGVLPVEKCYMAFMGQYWYDITGKQALDSYCRLHSINRDFFERLILRLCHIVEQLEWHLIDVNCLVLDPELVFMNVSGEEISFVAYPFHNSSLSAEVQQLLEYLLTKLDHKDTEAVGYAYKLYEMSLTEGISIQEMKKVILEEKAKSVVIEPILPIIDTFENKVEQHHEKAETLNLQTEWMQQIWSKIQPYYGKIKKIMNKYLSKEKKELEVVYPESGEEKVTASPEEIHIHPTVCIVSQPSNAGKLECEQRNRFPDYELEKEAYIIGKNPKVQLHIDKDTISQFHARIEYQGDAFFIEDLNSTNGTYVNEQPLSYKSRKRLQSGDSVRFGDVRYRFI